MVLNGMILIPIQVHPQNKQPIIRTDRRYSDTTEPISKASSGTNVRMIHASHAFHIRINICQLTSNVK